MSRGAIITRARLRQTPDTRWMEKPEQSWELGAGEWLELQTNLREDYSKFTITEKALGLLLVGSVYSLRALSQLRHYAKQAPTHSKKMERRSGEGPITIRVVKSSHDLRESSFEALKETQSFQLLMEFQ